MDTVDITPTSAACRQIARLFRAQQVQSEALIERAARALDALDGLDDREIGPWDRALLAAAFAALVQDKGAYFAVSLNGASGKSTRVFWKATDTFYERDTGGSTPV